MPGAPRASGKPEEGGQQPQEHIRRTGKRHCRPRVQESTHVVPLFDDEDGSLESNLDFPSWLYYYPPCNR